MKTILIALIVALSLTACGKDDGSGGGGNPLIGTYYFTGKYCETVGTNTQKRCVTSVAPQACNGAHTFSMGSFEGVGNKAWLDSVETTATYNAGTVTVAGGPTFTIQRETTLLTFKFANGCELQYSGY